MMVHLVLTALGAVAVETQSLVGQKLLGARVDGGANGNTARTGSVWRNRITLHSGGREREAGQLVHMVRGIGRASGIKQKHTQGQCLDVKMSEMIDCGINSNYRERTERDQLRRDPFDLAQTLRDSVGCVSLVSAIALATICTRPRDSKPREGW